MLKSSRMNIYQCLFQNINTKTNMFLEKVVKKDKISALGNINNYKNLSVVGEGSYGKVYKSKNVQDGKLYAVKK